MRRRIDGGAGGERPRGIFGLFTASRLRRRPARGAPDPGPPFACQCCGHLTLPDRGGHNICQVCFWEDDGNLRRNPDTDRSGPNGGLTLGEARRNFATYGAMDPRFRDNVRSPRPDEVPNSGGATS